MKKGKNQEIYNFFEFIPANVVKSRNFILQEIKRKIISSIKV